MANKVNIFEEASKKDTKIAYKGLQPINILWQLSIPQLKELAKPIEERVLKAKAFKSKYEDTPEDTKDKPVELTEDELLDAIFYHIITYKKAEQARKQEEKALQREIDKAQERIDRKKEGLEDSKSVEELEESLAAKKARLLDLK